MSSVARRVALRVVLVSGSLIASSVAAPLGGTLAALLDARLVAAEPNDPERGGSHRRRKRKRRHDPGGDKDKRKGRNVNNGDDDNGSCTIFCSERCCVQPGQPQCCDSFGIPACCDTFFP